LGLGSAYREGFIEGLRRGYHMLVEMDGDLSHDPAALPDLLRAVESGADLAVGSRYVPGGSIPHWSVRRRALSRWGNRYARWVLNLPLADATSGFRAYRADIVAKLDLPSIRSDGYGYQIEVAYRTASTPPRPIRCGAAPSTIRLTPNVTRTVRNSAPPAAAPRTDAAARPRIPPTARAAFRAPSPSGPVCSTSRARLGSSA